MKVCTDACLFGAWVADKLEKKEIAPETILDIGSGTGLLSMMLAQKSTATIDAIEINEDAFMQSQENTVASPYAGKINIVHSSIQHFIPAKKYDLIITNPPFYEKQLQSPDEKKNIAMHSASLSLQELVSFMKDLLSPNGKAAILLPHERIDSFEKEIRENGLYINEQVNISHTSTHKPFRTFFFISNKQRVTAVEKIEIKTAKGQYSSAFQQLLQDYYLRL